MKFEMQWQLIVAVLSQTPMSEESARASQDAFDMLMGILGGEGSEPVEDEGDPLPPRDASTVHLMESAGLMPIRKVSVSAE